MTWTFFSDFAVVLYPLWESREALLQITKGIVKVCVLFGRMIMTVLFTPNGPASVECVLARERWRPSRQEHHLRDGAWVFDSVN